MTHYDFKKRNDFVYVKYTETVVMNSEQITNKKATTCLATVFILSIQTDKPRQTV